MSPPFADFAQVISLIGLIGGAAFQFLRRRERVAGLFLLPDPAAWSLVAIGSIAAIVYVIESFGHSPWRIITLTLTYLLLVVMFVADMRRARDREAS